MLIDPTPEFRLPLARALLLRHLAFCLSTGFAYVYRRQLSIDESFLYAAGAAALLNLSVGVFSRWDPTANVSRAISFLFGVSSWCFMAYLSGGANSPFTLGLALEVLLSALSESGLATGLVTGGSLAGLWSVFALREELEAAQTPRILLTSILIISLGMLACFSASYWRLQRENLALRSRALTQRMTVLESEMEDLRPLSRCGENSAMNAHTLKNAVSSLRGYCQFLEGRGGLSESDRRALLGLKLAAEKVENTALETLSPLRDAAIVPTSVEDLQSAIHDAIQEAQVFHPHVQWSRRELEHGSAVRVPASLLREVVRLLVQNAAEALAEHGRVTLVTSAEPNSLRIDITDDGPGIAPEIRGKIFGRGVTTKASGSGLGLFLARRIVESYGGTLEAAPAAGCGATFTMRLPTSQPA